MKVEYVIAVVVIFILGCRKADVDLSPPTMEVLSYTPVPVEDEICGSREPVVFRLTGGDELTFDAIFSDDLALSQYKVDIHNNFDCHGHGGGSVSIDPSPNVDNLTTDWTVLDIENISGMSAQVTNVLNVPDNVTAGNYHYHIQVIDESGNDSPFANFHSLKIKNPLDDVSPLISIEKPSSGDLSIGKGEVVRFKGQVSDNRSLSDGGNGVLYLTYTDLSSGNSFSTDQVFTFGQNVDKVFDFDFEYTIPKTLVKGSYRYSLGANDGVRNVAPFVFFNVEVK